MSGYFRRHLSQLLRLHSLCLGDHFGVAYPQPCLCIVGFHVLGPHFLLSILVPQVGCLLFYHFFVYLCYILPCVLVSLVYQLD